MNVPYIMHVKILPHQFGHISVLVLLGYKVLFTYQQHRISENALFLEICISGKLHNVLLSDWRASKFNKCVMTSFQIKQMCVDYPPLVLVFLQRTQEVVSG